MISTFNLSADKSENTSVTQDKVKTDYLLKKAALLITASMHYLEAARLEESGDYKKADESTIQAEGILLLVNTFIGKNNFL